MLGFLRCRCNEFIRCWLPRGFPFRSSFLLLLAPPPPSPASSVLVWSAALFAWVRPCGEYCFVGRFDFFNLDLPCLYLLPFSLLFGLVFTFFRGALLMQTAPQSSH
eukprot:GHVT01019244.1.p1 GENE.GHVT01019244.1~~GHVT01019244.1.p1  ORF type:complete len:106 (+),score=12.98 GHVT01019244.1:589-906(+)